MRIIVRSKGVRLWLPIPLRLAFAAVNLLPRSVVEEMSKSVPAPYQELITKEYLREIVQECCSVMKEYRGLEIVEVKAQDGTYVSIRI